MTIRIENEPASRLDGVTAVPPAGDEIEQEILGREHRKRRIELTAGIATPILLLAAWELLSRTEVLNPRLFSSPVMVVQAAGKLIADGSIGTDILATVQRLVIGFIIGAVAGIALGLVLGVSRFARAALTPTLSALYAVPKIAILPLLLLLFGLGDVPLIIMVFFGVVFPVFISTESGVRNIDPQLIEAGKACGARKSTLFLRVILPGALSEIFAGLKVAAGLGTVVIIAAEFVSSNDGLGQLIWNSWTLLQPGPMFVGIVVTAIIGAVFIQLITVVERLVMPWRPSASVRRRRSAR